MWISTILAQASPQPQGNILLTFGPMILIFGIFYFLLIAPARKKQKAHAAMIEALKAGDKVVTNGGIHGVVVGVSNQVVQLRIADQVKIDVARHAISAMQAADS